MIKLIAGGEVYSPARLGKVDIMIANDRIVAVGNNLSPP